MGGSINRKEARHKAGLLRVVAPPRVPTVLTGQITNPLEQRHEPFV
jgi:hypothetical protein